MGLPNFRRPPFGDFYRDEEKAECAPSSYLLTAIAENFNGSLVRIGGWDDIQRIIKDYPDMNPIEQGDSIDKINNYLIRVFLNGGPGAPYEYAAKSLYSNVYINAVAAGLGLRELKDMNFADHLRHDPSFNISEYVSAFQRTLWSMGQQKFIETVWMGIHQAHTELGVHKINKKIYGIFVEKHPEYPEVDEINPLEVPNLITNYVRHLEQVLKSTGNLSKDHFKWPDY
ncbi:hypothetical protein GF312_10815 [Candidatus Poribacteria bacterium]|nr:hypothetical protein [Candidatus Poribacteria bacterium]